MPAITQLCSASLWGQPVRNRVRAEIKQEPRENHAGDRDRSRTCRPRRYQRKICSYDSGALQDVADRDRETPEYPAFSAARKIHVSAVRCFCKIYRFKGQATLPLSRQLAQALKAEQIRHFHEKKPPVIDKLIARAQQAA